MYHKAYSVVTQNFGAFFAQATHGMESYTKCLLINGKQCLLYIWQRPLGSYRLPPPTCETQQRQRCRTMAKQHQGASSMCLPQVAPMGMLVKSTMLRWVLLCHSDDAPTACWWSSFWHGICSSWQSCLHALLSRSSSALACQQYGVETTSSHKAKSIVPCGVPLNSKPGQS